MPDRLANMTMADGSRYFGSLPQTFSWYDLRDHIGGLAGTKLTGFITDHVTEAWIDVDYMDYHFSANDQYGEYWFFVDDPNCPDDILLALLAHCETLLGKDR